MPLVFENAWFFDLADAKCFLTATTMARRFIWLRQMWDEHDVKVWRADCGFQRWIKVIVMLFWRWNAISGCWVITGLVADFGRHQGLKSWGKSVLKLLWRWFKVIVKFIWTYSNVDLSVNKVLVLDGWTQTNVIVSSFWRYWYSLSSGFDTCSLEFGQ